MAFHRVQGFWPSMEFQMAKRKYEISGTTEDGDIWTFATDDRERAEEIREEMSDDLNEVETKGFD